MQLRLPEDLKVWLKRRAVESHRSANAEIVHLLQMQRQKENAPMAATVDASMQ
ncbi:Arc family DNA-binding protein [Achromobacter sp. KS-M25]|nr:Arc family DNA-binding protein [Achromobacter aestuarii]